MFSKLIEMFLKRKNKPTKRRNVYSKSTVMVSGSQAGGIAVIVCVVIVVVASCFFLICTIAVSLGLILNFSHPKSKESDLSEKYSVTSDYKTVPGGITFPFDKCGDTPTNLLQNSLVKRIINGNIANQHAWPWVVSLRTSSKNHHCGGSLVLTNYVYISLNRIKSLKFKKIKTKIQSDIVISAAHCFRTEIRYVYAGIFNKYKIIF
jgi:hypothetical protein